MSGAALEPVDVLPDVPEIVGISPLLEMGFIHVDEVEGGGGGQEELLEALADVDQVAAVRLARVQGDGGVAEVAEVEIRHSAVFLVGVGGEEVEGFDGAFCYG